MFGVYKDNPEWDKELDKIDETQPISIQTKWICKNCNMVEMIE
jgi:hypothetical protein